MDYVNRQRRIGVDVDMAVRRAGMVRFRPVLITSVTTFAGLLPLMLNDNPATAFFVPMTVSLGWGLLFATAITLFLMPCLYLAVQDLLPTKRTPMDSGHPRGERPGAGGEAEGGLVPGASVPKGELG